MRGGAILEEALNGVAYDCVVIGGGLTGPQKIAADTIHAELAVLAHGLVCPQFWVKLSHNPLK